MKCIDKLTDKNVVFNLIIIIATIFQARCEKYHLQTNERQHLVLSCFIIYNSCFIFYCFNFDAELLLFVLFKKPRKTK